MMPTLAFMRRLHIKMAWPGDSKCLYAWIIVIRSDKGGLSGVKNGGRASSCALIYYPLFRFVRSFHPRPPPASSPQSETPVTAPKSCIVFLVVDTPLFGIEYSAFIHSGNND